MKRIVVIFILLFESLILFTGCSSDNKKPVVTESFGITATDRIVIDTPFVFTETPVMIQSVVVPTATVPVEPAPSATIEIPTQTLTEESSRDDWVWHDSELPVTAPILLYHHITPEEIDNEYYLALDLFEQHMEWVTQQGYTTITISQLADALTKGTYLPEKPILITFDDGYDDLYQYAYPVMKSRGMVATAYLIGFCLDAEGCISTEQVRMMAESGWEFGVHSMSHQNLTTVSDLNYEMYQPRVLLERKLNLPLTTFAYPYGAGNDFIYRKSWQYGYSAAVGLGKHVSHYPWSLFYLSRMVISDGMTTNDLEAIIQEARMNDGF